MTTIRPAYGTWPKYNQRLRDVVAAMTDEQLAIQPSPERWPLWATVGHAACQRVFWLCDFAGEPGAETTPFTNAAYDCPGDDDLEHVLGAGALVDALDSTFRDRRGLPRPVDDRHARRGDPPPGMGRGLGAHPRLGHPARLRHDVYHVAELNETLGAAGLPQIDLWG